MKAGIGLQDLAVAVNAQRDLRLDYITPVPRMEVRGNGHSELVLAGATNGGNDDAVLAMSSVASQQLAAHLGVPKRFYDDLVAHTSDWRDPYADRPLFDAVMNGLLRDAARQGEKRMVRVLNPLPQALDGLNVAGLPAPGSMPLARAVLSERYRPIDNYEILQYMLPVLGNVPGVDWGASSLNVTDQALYLKVTNARVQTEVAKGDVIQAGVMIRNSEVGLGSFSVQPFYVRLVCLNGMVATDLVKRKYHAGGHGMAMEDDGNVAMYLSDETIKARNAATILEMRDLVREALGEVMLEQIAGKLRAAQGIKITGDPVATVEEVTQRWGLTQDEGSGVLRALIEGGDLSLYGLSNAVTWHAQQLDSYDRSTELEGIGGKLVAIQGDKALIKAVMDRRN